MRLNWTNCQRPVSPDRSYSRIIPWAGVVVSLALFVQSGYSWQIRPVTPKTTDTVESSISDNAEEINGPAVAPVVGLESLEQQPSSSKSQSEPNRKPAVRSPSFKDVTPGRTSLVDARRILGEPADQYQGDSQTTLLYNIEPFSRVEVIAENDTVVSIVIYLEEPSDVLEIAEELNISDIQPAPISDEVGELLGQIYPERGVLFGFAEGDSNKKVAQIVLEPIRAEPFVLRAQFDFDHNYGQNLVDLHYASQLEPDNAHTHWLLSETYASIANLDLALKHADKAVNFDRESAAYRLTRARILGRKGQSDFAIQQTKEVLALDDITAEVRARAQAQLGNLIAGGSRPDYKQSINHHMAAIKLSAPLANDDRFMVRREAKRILIDAHLGVANDVANGRWRRKQEVVPKWLRHAEAIAKEMIDNDGGTLDLRLAVKRTALGIFAKNGSAGDPTGITDAVMDDAEQLLANVEDPLYEAQIRRALAGALYDAAIIQQRRGKADEAIQYAEIALASLDESVQNTAGTPARGYHLGGLCFLIGSVHAVQKRDHETAIGWYRKAQVHLANAEVPARDLQIHGDRYVAMGVSYWNKGEHQEAIELTKQGTRIIQNAVENKLVSNKALTIPYNNLAGMYRQLGNEKDAKQFANIAARLKKLPSGVQRR